MGAIFAIAGGAIVGSALGWFTKKYNPYNKGDNIIVFSSVLIGTVIFSLSMVFL